MKEHKGLNIPDIGDSLGDAVELQSAFCESSSSKCDSDCHWCLFYENNLGNFNKWIVDITETED